MASLWSSIFPTGFLLQNAAPPPQQSGLTLMNDIPPELRERIWKLTLIQRGPIIVDAASHELPAILRVSRDIRAEALGFYMLHNTFCIPILAFRLDVPPLHWVWWTRMHNYTLIGGPFSWSNLKQWLWRCYNGTATPAIPRTGAPVPAAFVGQQARINVMIQTFPIVRGLLLTPGPRIPWTVVNQVLEAYKIGVQLLSANWQFDP